MLFNVVIVRPYPEYHHSKCFRELQKLLVCSLTDLGHTAYASWQYFDPNAVNIILGWHLLTEIPKVPYIVYQLEQLPNNVQSWGVLERAAAIWDYSQKNVAYLANRGISAEHLPIGYHNALKTIPWAEQDIGVLFYGWVNERRARMLNELVGKCQLHVIGDGNYDTRDSFIARAKIVLNVHFYPAQIFEQTRVSYALNNRKFVISETSEEAPYGNHAYISVDYDKLAETCLHWLHRDMSRDIFVDTAFKEFEKLRMTDYLKEVL